MNRWNNAFLNALFHWSWNYLSFNTRCHNSESEAGWQSSLSPGSRAGPNLPSLPNLRKPNVQPWDRMGRCLLHMLVFLSLDLLAIPDLSKALTSHEAAQPQLKGRCPGADFQRKGAMFSTWPEWIVLMSLATGACCGQGFWRFCFFCLLISLAAWSWVRQMGDRDFMCSFLTKEENNLLGKSDFMK